jgi:hypothetical protein
MYTASPLRQTFRRFLIAAVLVLLAATLAIRRTDAQSQPGKLTTVLADLVQSTERGQLAATPGASLTSAQSIDVLPRSVRDAMGSGWLRVDDTSAVQVYILLRAVDDGTVGQLTAAGVTIEIADVGRRRVQARVPVSRLRSVAELPIVDAIRLPSYARRRTGIVNTEGDAIVGAADVRQQLGLDGTGVRVGVISDGLKGVFATDCTACGGVAGGPIESGDLPGAIGLRNSKGVLTAATGGIVARSFSANGDLEGLPPTTPACGSPSAGAEGTALLEIVHDLALGAKLSFANFDTDLEFNQAVNFLAASNDVVIDDIGFYGEPSDGTSAVSTNTAAALNNTGFPIRAYVTSVGNDANEHYYGAYAGSGVDGTSIGGITTPGPLHLFQRTADTTDVLGLGAQPYNLIKLPQNGEVAIFLTWNEAGAAEHRAGGGEEHRRSGRPPGSVGVHRLREQGRRGCLPHHRAECRRRGAAKESEPVFVPAAVRDRWSGTARSGSARAAQLQHRDAERRRAERRGWIAGGRGVGRCDLLGVG